MARRENLTIRQLYERQASAWGLRVLIGSAEQIADDMQNWFENGAADGFNICPPYLPGGLEKFVELVVPELQRRGLFRTQYEVHAAREPRCAGAAQSTPDRTCRATKCRLEVRELRHNGGG